MDACIISETWRGNWRSNAKPPEVSSSLASGVKNIAKRTLESDQMTSLDSAAAMVTISTTGSLYILMPAYTVDAVIQKRIEGRPNKT
jgi:hypothetical protein